MLLFTKKKEKKESGTFLGLFKDVLDYFCLLRNKKAKTLEHTTLAIYFAKKNNIQNNEKKLSASEYLH